MIPLVYLAERPQVYWILGMLAEWKSHEGNKQQTNQSKYNLTFEQDKYMWYSTWIN